MLKVISIIILSVAAYFGYQYYKTHIAAAPTIEDKPLIWAWSLSAALNEKNGADHFTYGGDKNDSYKGDYKKALSAWWSIDSKEQALQTIAELSEGQGHHSAFVEEYGSLFEATDAEWKKAAEQNSFIRELALHKKTISDQGLLAWDYSRAQWVIGIAHKAGYLNRDEARKLAIPLAIKTQATFSSWEGMANNYALGLYYWSQDTSEFYKIKAINSKLLSSKNSPWQVLEWNLTMESTLQ